MLVLSGVAEPLTDLLEDTQVGEGSRNVQLDQLQARFPVWRTSIWTTWQSIKKHDILSDILL